jgi:hypothetical protein
MRSRSWLRIIDQQARPSGCRYQIDVIIISRLERPDHIRIAHSDAHRARGRGLSEIHVFRIGLVVIGGGECDFFALLSCPLIRIWISFFPDKADYVPRQPGNFFNLKFTTSLDGCGAHARDCERKGRRRQVEICNPIAEQVLELR